MAIEKRFMGNLKYHTLVCDHCGDEAGHFDDFYEAVDRKKEFGYRSMRIDGEWNDICPNCAELMQYKAGTATAAEDFAGL